MTLPTRPAWNEQQRKRSLAVRRDLRAEHDHECISAIRAARSAGLSWRATARALAAAGFAPPRAAARGRTPGGEVQANLFAQWTHAQVRRIAERHGVV